MILALTIKPLFVQQDLNNREKSKRIEVSLKKVALNMKCVKNGEKMLKNIKLQEEETQSWNGDAENDHWPVCDFVDAVRDP